MTTRKKRLSPQQLKVLHNLCLKKASDAHIIGSAQHGAFGQTTASLLDRGLIKRHRFRDLDDLRACPAHEITKEGVLAHRAGCCTRGLNEDDLLVVEVEYALENPSNSSLRDFAEA